MLVVESLIAVAIALTTAFGSLVADDIISADASCTVSILPDLWSHHCSTLPRIAWFVGSAALLIGAMALRHWMINRNGTLYYLRLLPASSPDHMRGAMDLARTHSLDFRTATGWFGAEGDVLDLRDDVACVSDELERAMNDDDEATGYLFAPNLSFPAALSVGYDVLLRQQTSLAEVPDGDPSTHGSAEGRPRRGASNGAGIRTVHFDDGYNEWSSRQWIAHHDHPAPDITLTTLGEVPADRHAVRRVWLSLQLGATGPVAEVDAQYPLRDTCDVVVVAGPVETVDGQARMCPWELPGTRSFPWSDGSKIDPESFARLLDELSGAIEHVLDDYPEAEVLLSGGLPRSVEFALGFVISERKDSHISGKRADLHRPQPGDSPAEQVQARAENAGLSSLSRFWTSVTPVLTYRGEARPTLVHPAQRADVVFGLPAAQPTTPYED